MLQPKRTKFRKMQKGRNRGLAERGSKVSFGEFALKAIGRGRMTARQIEAARRTITRRVKRGGKLWIRVFPDKPITQKPLEVRQGKGKGSVEYWVCQINLNMARATGQLAQTHLLAQVRHDIARIKTVIAQKEIAA